MADVLWAKGVEINDLMRELTVGNDFILDRHIAAWDCVGSAAHVQMLASVGLLTADDRVSLLRELAALHAQAVRGELAIPPELEDVQTVIESALNERLGDAGRRIHTGRSRNDQVLTATRLYTRHETAALLQKLAGVLATLHARALEMSQIEMPGYTHMQPAMPSSVGMWLHSYLEGGLWLLREGLFLIDELNTNPLGAAAGFGTPLPLERELTTKLLGFSRVQRSPIDCNNSRGRYEERFVRWGADIAALFEKFACDMMLYTTREYGFFSLPDALTTGSSIMPQKKNCDIVELLRARAAKVRAAAIELSLVTAKLPSSYHRDLQYTKEPLIRAVGELDAILKMSQLVISSCAPKTERLKEAMYTDLYATYAAFHLVNDGMPFRDAYREVAAQVLENRIDTGRVMHDFAVIQRHTERDLQLAKGELDGHAVSVASWSAKIAAVVEGVFTAG